MTGRAGLAGRLLEALGRRGEAPSQRWEGPAGWESRSGAALRDAALRVAARLRALGVGPGDRVALVADGGPRWLEADLGVLALGAVDVPRGSDVPAPELARILEHSGCGRAIAVGEAALSRVLEARHAVPGLETVIRLDGEASGEGVLGEAAFRSLADAPLDAAALPVVAPGDPATLVYTSGTTGHPKGVTLLHGNLLHQVEVLPPAVDFHADDLFLSMLPPWHAYERIVEYLAAVAGGEVAFTDTRRLRDHLAAVRPTWMASVPRVWEMVLALSGYGRLRGKDPARAAATLRGALGGRLRTGVSGGGSLPEAVDRCYAEAGIRLLVGYGLTETAPVLTVRDPRDNVPGTVGRPVAGTEIRLLRRDGGGEAAPGEPGRVVVRGPQVMAGYWREPDLTAAVLDGDRWLDTGDLGSWAPSGDLVFRGRTKETIVLRGGENVEPSHVEGRLQESPLVEWVVVAGQDRKVLSALIVPRREALDEAARAARGGSAPATAEEATALLREECGRLLTPAAGFGPHERVALVHVLEDRFTQENGLLTATLKVRRGEVLARYAARVASLYGDDGSGHGGLRSSPP